MGALVLANRLTPDDLNAWPRSVSVALMALVNRRGIKFRIIDGSHILLYPPGKDSRPVKFSAKRPEEANIHFLEEFVGKYVPRLTDTRPATDDELAPLISLNGAKVDRHAAEKAARDAEKDAAEWHPYITTHGVVTYLETNGRVYRCGHPDADTGAKCGWITSDRMQLGRHTGNHKMRDNARARREERAALVPPPPTKRAEPADRVTYVSIDLRSLRDAAGIPRSQFAAAVGVSKSAVQAWEKTGRVKSAYVPAITTALSLGALPAKPLAEPASEPVKPPTEPAVASVPGGEPEPVSDPPTPFVGTVSDTDAARLRGALEAIAEIVDKALGRPDALAALQARLDENETALALIRETVGMLTPGEP